VAGTLGGTTYGVAKLVSLKSVKVIGADGKGTVEAIVSGIGWVTNSRNKTRKAVANFSITVSPASIATDNAATGLIADGVTFVVAGGNYNLDACNYSPGRVAASITVGATDKTDTRGGYSNWGGCLTVFAPGTDILSAWIGNSTATHTISGTSMAAPHVAGIVALHLADFGGTPANNKLWITTGATAALVTNPGVGSPNLLAFSPSS